MIETERLVLRRLRSTDAAARFEYASDPAVARYMDWRMPSSVSEVAARIEESAARWSSGEEFSWSITVKPDDLAVGGVACYLRGDAAELGFVLARKFWGRGFATEATKAVFDWVSSLESVARIWATCDTENVASARVLENIGMTRERLLRRWVVRPNLDPEVRRNAFLFSWTR